MRDPYFPFRALGLRANPFRALTDDEWADVVVLPPAAEAAVHSAIHLQVLGEMGRGKTSTLLGLAARLRRAGQRAAYEYLPLGQRAFRAPLAGLDVFLLDEAQRLRSGERRRLLAAAAGGLRLVVGSHEDLSPLFARRGLAVVTVQLGAPDYEHLERVLRRRLDYFALDPARPAISLAPAAVAALHAAYGSDLRAIERCLYEVFQSLEAPGEVPREAILPRLPPPAPTPASAPG